MTYINKKYRNKWFRGNKFLFMNICKNMNLPIPYGFVIAPLVSNLISWKRSIIPLSLKYIILAFIQNVLNIKNINIFSIRSGSYLSMPGIMSSILNIGFNFNILKIFLKISNIDFVLNCYREYMSCYSQRIIGVEKFYTANIDNYFIKKSICLHDNPIMICHNYYNIYRKKVGNFFSLNLYNQLINSINAVIKSWYSMKACLYRKHSSVKCYLGTSILVQSMIFGNKNIRSGTGVIFSRDIISGKKIVFGEFMSKKQGENIVLGDCTPLSNKGVTNNKLLSIENILVHHYYRIKKLFFTIEKVYKRTMEIEFTLENNMFWILQARFIKVSDRVLYEINFDLLKKQIINKRNIIQRFNIGYLKGFSYCKIITNQKAIAEGIPISSGVASGYVVFLIDNKIKPYCSIILIKSEITSDDIHYLNLVSALVTIKSSMTSHASVIARGMGKPYIGGIKMIINISKMHAIIGGDIIRSNDIITLDANNGKVFIGRLKIIKNNNKKKLLLLMKISRKKSLLKIMSNVNNVDDCKVSKMFSTQGVGLCRTEHMFFEKNRINFFRSMLFSNDDDKFNMLSHLYDMQKYDFIKIIDIMRELPIKIRLLDSPLTEFLPKINSKDIDIISKLLKCNKSFIRNKILNLQENYCNNLRGCRIAIIFPQIYQMQIKSIVDALNFKRSNITYNIGIIIPMVTNSREMLLIKKKIIKIFENCKSSVNLEIGAMIESTSSILNINSISRQSDFVSFGTNDLVQSSFNISRENSCDLINTYKKNKIIHSNPFTSLYGHEISKLIDIGFLQCRKNKPKIKIGICGEQGTDSKSINFFVDRNIDYISCSPYKIPLVQICASKKTF